MFALHLRLVFLLASIAHVSNASVTKRSVTNDIGAALHEIPIRYRNALMTRTIKSLWQTAKRSANSEGSCRWDTLTEACVVGHGAVADLFDNSSNVHAQFVAKSERCLAAVDAEECAAISHCDWDTDALMCRFLDLYTGYENSPCVVGAKGYIQELIAQETCRLHKSQLPCMKDHSCEWNQEELSCDVSGFVFFIGVPFSKMIEASQEVIAYKTNELLFHFYISFDIFAEGFEVEDILDWEIPETSCPEWSDPLVCDYVDGVLSTVAQTYYCSAKHQGFYGLLDCAADPMCKLHPASSSCGQTDESFRPGIFKGIKAVISRHIQAPVDKKLLLQVFECVEIEDKEKCKEPCAWTVDKTAKTETEECTIPGTWIANVIAEEGDDSDPICKTANIIAKKKCVDITDPEACDAEHDCSTLVSGYCWVSVDYQAKDVMKTDSDLQISYGTLQDVCSVHKTEEACHAGT